MRHRTPGIVLILALLSVALAPLVAQEAKGPLDLYHGAGGAVEAN